MSTEDNPPPLEPFIDPGTEARLVALILGEASDFERAELEELLKSDPALRAAHLRLSQLHALLARGESTEAIENPPPAWKLPKERRSALLEKISLPADESNASPTALVTSRSQWNRWPWISAVAALIMICFFVPTTFNTMQKSGDKAAAQQTRQQELRFRYDDAPDSDNYFRYQTQSEEKTRELTIPTGIAEHESLVTDFALKSTEKESLGIEGGIGGGGAGGQKPGVTTKWFARAQDPRSTAGVEWAGALDGGTVIEGQQRLATPVLGKEVVTFATQPEERLTLDIVDAKSGELEEFAEAEVAALDVPTPAAGGELAANEKEESGADPNTTLGNAILGEKTAPFQTAVEPAAAETVAKTESLAQLTGGMPSLASESNWRWEYDEQQDAGITPPPVVATNGIVPPPLDPRIANAGSTRAVEGFIDSDPTSFDGSIHLGTTDKFLFGTPKLGVTDDSNREFDRTHVGTSFEVQPVTETPYDGFSAVPNQTADWDFAGEGEGKGTRVAQGGFATGFAETPPVDGRGTAGRSNFGRNYRFALPEPAAATTATAEEKPAPAPVRVAGAQIGGIAERQIIRSLEWVKEAEGDVELGQELWEQMDYAGGHQKFKAAVDKIPDAPLVKEQREQAIQQFSDATVLLADQKAREGARGEARKLLEDVLDEEIDPQNEDAKKMLARLDDPEFYNHASTPKHVEKVAEVERLSRLGEGYFDLGDLDSAEKNYQQMLQIDPDSKDAREGLQGIERQRGRHLAETSDHSRSLLLHRVDGAWETAVPAPKADSEEAAQSAPSNEDDGLAWARQAEPELGLSSIPYALTDIEARRDITPEEGRVASNFTDTDGDRYASQIPDVGGVASESRTDHWADLNEPTWGLYRPQAAGTAAAVDKKLAASDRLYSTVDELTRAVPAAKAALDLEVPTAAEPFSTFSLNVSDVSFKLAQAALIDNGSWPEANKIRPEEFVNALDYADPAPAQDEAVSSITEQCVHPFLPGRNLLRVSMSTAATGRAASTPLRLTVLLDKSGSMERADREASVAKAMEALAAQLKEGDEITVVGFARTPHLIADRLPGAKADDLAEMVADAPSEGGTNLEEALRLATDKAQAQFLDGAENRIVLLTDGAANLGDAAPESLQKRIISLRSQGIAFDACGVGADGLNDEILEALTRKGDGRYYFLDRPEDADAAFVRQLAGALRPAAKNVKVQVKFNPQRVTSYRLSGFEKHRLNKEDFRNDKVDAAELAAAESGNAVYQIELDPAGQGNVGDVFVRFHDLKTGQMVERSWPIPYQPSAPTLADAPPSMQTAALASIFAEKLKGGPLGELVNLDDLTPIATALRGASPKTDILIGMIEKARGLQ